MLKGKLFCSIYKTRKKSGMYLFVDRQKGLKNLPEVLVKQFGAPIHVNDMILSPDRPLARADVNCDAATNVTDIVLVVLVVLEVPFSDVLRHRITWGMIFVAWTIVLAAAIDPVFPDARGLEFGKNIPNTIAFLLFYAGILTVIWVVAVVAVKSLAATRDKEST